MGAILAFLKRLFNLRRTRMPGPTPQEITIVNPGPNAIRVTGGTAGTPVDITVSGTATVGYTAPLTIQLLDEGGGLAGGPGEE